MIRSRRCPPNFSFLIGLVVTLTWAWHAEAANLTFQASIEGTPKSATEETVTVQGVTYVSLRLLTEKFGGAYNIQQTDTKVDLAGATAWVESNNDEVSALTIFSLTYPILHRNGDVLIAAVDVPLFFQKGFGVAVAQQTRIQPSAPTGIETKTILRRPIRVIVIDAGHGGQYEPGVVGPGGLLEKDLTLTVGLQLQQILAASTSQDLKVVLTRKDDPEDSGLSLRQRAALSKDAEGDLLISIHCGGSFSPTASGLTLYYPPPRPANEPRSLLLPYNISEQSEEIAVSIANSLGRITAAEVGRIQPAPCALLKASEIPGLLIEIGHLTNATEEALLGTRSYQQQIAQGIATGLISYLDSHSNRRKPVAANNRPTWNAPNPTTGKISPTLE